MFKNSLLMTASFLMAVSLFPVFSAQMVAEMGVIDAPSDMGIRGKVPYHKKDMPFDYETATPYEIAVHHSFFLHDAPWNKLLSTNDLRRIAYGFTREEREAAPTKLHKIYPLFNIRSVSRWDDGLQYDWKNYDDRILRNIIDKGTGSDHARRAAFNHLLNWIHVHYLTPTEEYLTKVVFLSKLVLWDPPIRDTWSGRLNILKCVQTDASQRSNLLDTMRHYIDFGLDKISEAVLSTEKRRKLKGTLKAHLARLIWLELLDEKAEQSWDQFDPQSKKRKIVFSAYNEAFKKRRIKICLLEMMRLIREHGCRLNSPEESDEHVLQRLAKRYREMNKGEKSERLSLKRKKGEMEKGHVPLPSRGAIDLVDAILSQCPAAIIEEYDSDDGFIDNTSSDVPFSGKVVAVSVESDLEEDEEVIIKGTRRFGANTILKEDDDEIDGTRNEAFDSGRRLVTAALSVDTSFYSAGGGSSSRSSDIYEKSSSSFKSPSRAKKLKSDKPERCGLTWDEQVQVCALFDCEMTNTDVAQNIQKSRGHLGCDYSKLLENITSFKGDYYLIIEDAINGTNLESYPTSTDHLTDEDKVEMARLHNEEGLHIWQIAKKYTVSFGSAKYYIVKEGESNVHSALTQETKEIIRNHYQHGMKPRAIAELLKLDRGQVANYTRRSCPLPDAGEGYTGEVAQLIESQKSEISILCHTMTDRDLAIRYNTVISVILSAKKSTPRHKEKSEIIRSSSYVEESERDEDA